MRIDVTQEIKDFEGESIKDNAGKVLTFRNVVGYAINNLEQNQTAEDKNACFQLGVKLYSTKEPDFTVNQLALIRKKVEKTYNPLIVGRICEIVEGTNVTGEIPETPVGQS